MIRRFLWLLVGVASLFLVPVAATWVWLKLDRPIHVVKIEGVTLPVEQEAIRTVLADVIAGGVLSADLDQIASTVRTLNWLRDVRVHRSWPEGLRIEVQLEPLVANWGDGDFLTSGGKVVSLTGHVAPDLPKLTSSLSTPTETMQMFLLLREQVSASELSISSLEENTLGEWRLVLDNGVAVALGGEQLAERLKRFLVLYHRVLADRNLVHAEVDARYPNGLAVRLEEAEPEAIPTKSPRRRDPGDRSAMLAFGGAQEHQPTDPDTRNGI